MPVAKSVTAMAQASLLSLCTTAIAMSVQKPISRIAAHFTGPYLGLADDDALTPCIQSCTQRTHYLPLGRALRLVLGLQRDRELQSFYQMGRQGCEREMLMRHCWPFSVNCFVYVTLNQSMKMRSLLIRQALSEQNGGSECAGLCGNRNLGLIEVVPDLYGDETDQQAEDDPKWW